MFVTAYFGLFRIGEISAGDHPVLARDVHIGENKDKLMFILRSSKTHNIGSKPQTVKLQALGDNKGKFSHHVCPFWAVKQYLKVRPKYISGQEQFFVFGDRTPVSADKFRLILKKVLHTSGFDAELYSGQFQNWKVTRLIENGCIN